MSKRKVPGYGYDSETKHRILGEATKLIALRGFGAVSMRDIAKTAGIQTSTIYYYYKSKDILLEDVLARFEAGYKQYFDRMLQTSRTAASLAELMDNIFNTEFIETLNPMAYFSMSITVKEQHSNIPARKCAFELFFEYGITRMQTAFDHLIDIGVIPPSDTRMVATLLMFFVLGNNDIRMHEYAGTKPPVDYIELYRDLKKFMTSALAQGVCG
ncbi:MAG: TetR/AcrR family transcriptional regulator [Firmicutes bacterium]|nr:TetR/AcrR family transcriptional regulator [Bacillota bacterium]